MVSEALSPTWRLNYVLPHADTAFSAHDIVRSNHFRFSYHQPKTHSIFLNQLDPLFPSL
jgi:hypothetical protein